jgi:hypothetical protein
MDCDGQIMNQHVRPSAAAVVLLLMAAIPVKAQEVRPIILRTQCANSFQLPFASIYIKEIGISHLFAPIL